MKITITLKEPARSQAEAAMIARGLRDGSEAEPFLGPVFEDADWSTDEDICPPGSIAVQVEGATYLYPLIDIARLELS